MTNWLSQIKYLAKGRHRRVILVFIIFYLVGVAGFIYPGTSAVFAGLTPVILIMSFVAVIVYHGESFTLKHFMVLLGIFLISFVSEAIGVNTGLIFGSYQYGESLGLKFFGTPVLIGMNWVFLIYSSASLINMTRVTGSIFVFLASSLMVFYDLILEQVAGEMGMWSWTDGFIPLKNYITWFILAVVFHWMLKYYAVPTINKVAPAIFTIQFMFFLMIFLLKGVVV
ncbi:MAG TPA: hypothetical protein DCY35_08110 [Prolixibacteraceae bacterium]|nr:hypothetical protein [Prolixibacteraceae bacterium]